MTRSGSSLGTAPITGLPRLVAPFFTDRFSSMRWDDPHAGRIALLDLHDLQFGPGSNRASAPSRDELEEMWKSYYASTFNPARIKLKAMRTEMPRRYWPTLPRNRDHRRDAGRGTKARGEMATNHENWSVCAVDFLPENQDLENLRLAAQGCQGCPLYTDATQTVFGEGPPDARLVLIGEQPGDEEDLAGQPFVGPAGRVLNEVLGEVGIDRRQVYMTNAVKHFKHVQRGKKRLHKKPKRIEVVSCRACWNGNLLHWLHRSWYASARPLHPASFHRPGRSRSSVVTLLRHRGARRPLSLTIPRRFCVRRTREVQMPSGKPWWRTCNSPCRCSPEQAENLLTERRTGSGVFQLWPLLPCVLCSLAANR